PLAIGLPFWKLKPLYLVSYNGLDWSASSVGAVAPIFLKGLRCDGWQVARFGPAAGGVENGAFDEGMQFAADASESLRQTIDGRTIYDERKQFEGQSFPKRRLLMHGVAAILKQVMVQIDFDGTGLGASAAEGTGVGKMFPILQAPQMR